MTTRRRSGRRVWIAAAFLIILFGVSPSRAQAPEPDCADSTQALEWWVGQRDRVRSYPERSLETFWANVIPRLQLEAVPDLRETCNFLELVISSDTSDPHQAADRLSLAMNQSVRLEGGAGRLAQPTIFASAGTVGKALEAKALDTQATLPRIAILREVRDLYHVVGRAGGEARITLWLDAEESAWSTDAGRVARDLERSRETSDGLLDPVAMIFYLGETQEIAQALNIDRNLMESHGDQARVSLIDDASASLRVSQSRATLAVLEAAGVMASAAASLAWLIRLPLRALERDVREVEIANGGVYL